jgi:hypothetical protein
MKARISLVSLSARIRTVQGILATFKGLRTVFTDDFHFYPFYKFWLLFQVPPRPVRGDLCLSKPTGFGAVSPNQHKRVADSYKTSELRCSVSIFQKNIGRKKIDSFFVLAFYAFLNCGYYLDNLIKCYA